MKITNVSQQKRRKDRFSIYIDGTYRLSLSQNQLLDSGLRSGDEITDAQIADLENQSELGKALDRAYNYLSYRSRSQYELQTYLRGKQYDDEMITGILQRLTEQKYIDDAQFAREWVENRQLLSPRSKRELQAELRKKGVSSAIIEEALETIDDADEKSSVLEVIQTKRLLQRYTDERKLIHYLSTKGYSFGAITRALAELAETT